MLKKLGCIVLSAVLCLLGASCSPKTNTIGPRTLTQDQKTLVDFLQDGSERYLLFSYKAEAQFKDVDVWVETYQQGVLKESRAGGVHIMTDGIKPHNGELAIVITQNPDFQWKFILSDEGGFSSTSDPNKDYLTSGNGTMPLTAPLTIEDGKEIALYASVFTDDNSIHTFDPQDFVRDPDLLKQYAYAHLIKCKFSK